MKLNSKNQEDKGQATLEIIIALGLIAVVLTSVILVISTSQSLSLDSGENNQAVALARENLETVKAMAKSNFSEIKSSSSVQNGFFREIIVQNIDNFTKQITSRVSWQTDSLRTQKAELPTIITDPETVKSLGGDIGGGGLTGDWENPKTLGSVDLGPGSSATGLDVLNKIVYLTAEASDNKKHDFYVVDATNGQNPVITASINTGAGLLGVDAAGNYAYVVGKDNAEEFQIIDVSNISAPRKVATVDLAGNADALTVFYAGDYAYVGRETGSAGEFAVINISNPANPLVAGSYETNDDVNDIYVSGDRAYLATDLGGAGLAVLDIANPASIAALGQSYSADTHSVFAAVPSKLLLGPAQEFHVVDVSSPGAINTLGVFNPGDVVNDIATRDYLAFVATSNSNREFQVVNISSSTSPALHSSFNFPQVASGLDYEDNIVYVSVRSNDALRIITSGP